MVCMEFDRFHQDVEGRIVPIFKMLFRVEIARSEFTYINAGIGGTTSQFGT